MRLKRKIVDKFVCLHPPRLFGNCAGRFSLDGNLAYPIDLTEGRKLFDYCALSYADLLCDICFAVRYLSQRAGWRIRVYENLRACPEVEYIKDFKNTSEQGCELCSFILGSILHFNPSSAGDATVVIDVYAPGQAELLLPSIYETIQLYTPIGHSPAWEGIVVGPELSHQRDSEDAYRFIEACLAKCDQHSTCKPVLASVPTQLIDVGQLECNEVRLADTFSSCENEYIALSYCWGRVDSLKTAASNYESMKREIQVSCLPRPIQDAIMVTRRLKHRYLWVDAICIILDSAADWKIESSKMACAAEGFLHYKHPLAESRPPLSVEWKSAAGQQTVLGARTIPARSSHTTDSDGLETPPLWCRGWTLQESSLSRRVFTYNSEELWWSCLGGLACECKVFDSIPAEDRPFSDQVVCSIDKTREAYRKWHDVVEEYTNRQLTEPLDRLPAISGIAHVFQRITNSQYIAGLWPDNLIPRSWLGRRWVTAEWCAVVHTGATVLGLNPLGRVQSAYATLRGLLEIYVVSRGSAELRPYVDMALESFVAVNTEDVMETSIRQAPLKSSKKRIESPTPVYLLYLGYWLGERPARSQHLQWLSHAYLLLGKSPADMSKYERLGLVSEHFFARS
ncbi:uncharacterized protein BDW43DRAFT_319895 [Aspergillus alliaceus]|uniref:uncharacterized protein n=1 Tax=Petromyces alliaceus TaxID=209559 RepID=UPI0012A4FDFD|nr:uncharacterized protein BDW43DRAFT_319895 [Aspergillus alliaceus]KAB8233185.1 hypothetical protein BDW43DRAFT_319895 [Aspergillus alliaceus]